MRSLALLALIAMGAPPLHTHAQRLAVGDEIRVGWIATTPFERSWGPERAAVQWTEGTLVRLTRDTIWYRSGGETARRAVHDTEIRRSTGRDRRVPAMLVGAVMGGAIVGGIAYARFEPEYNYQGTIGGAAFCALKRCHVPQSNSRTEETVGGVIFGVSVGGLLGYWLGSTLGRWESVDVLPTGGASLALRLRVRT